MTDNNMDHLTSRAQRLIEEFGEGQDTRHGIANVLRHVACSFNVNCYRCAQRIGCQRLPPEPYRHKALQIIANTPRDAA